MRRRCSSRPTTPGARWPPRSPSAARRADRGHQRPRDALGVRAWRSRTSGPTPSSRPRRRWPPGTSTRRLARRRRGAQRLAAPGRCLGPDQGVERWDGGVVIAMTSGSTGRPKCVVQSEAALRYAGQATIDAVGLQPGDPVGALVPLSSVAAFCFGMYLPAMLGSPMVCLDELEPEDAVDAAPGSPGRAGRCWCRRWPSSSPWSRSSEGALSSLPAMTVGGGPMNARALQQAEDHLGTTFLRVFGMSECLGHTTPLPSRPADIRLGRDGRPFPGTEVRVVGADGSAAARSARSATPRSAGPRCSSATPATARRSPRSSPTTVSCRRATWRDVNEDGTINIRRPREADHHPRRPQHRHQRGRGSGGRDPRGRPGVCRPGARRPAGGARRRTGRLRRGPRSALDGGAPSTSRRADFPKFKWPEFVYAVPALPQNRVGKLNRTEAISLASELSGTAGGGRMTSNTRAVVREPASSVS